MKVSLDPEARQDLSEIQNEIRDSRKYRGSQESLSTRKKLRDKTT